MHSIIAGNSLRKNKPRWFPWKKNICFAALYRGIYRKQRNGKPILGPSGSTSNSTILWCLQTWLRGDVLQRSQNFPSKTYSLVLACLGKAKRTVRCFVLWLLVGSNSQKDKKQFVGSMFLWCFCQTKVGDMLILVLRRVRFFFWRMVGGRLRKIWGSVAPKILWEKQLVA